MKIVFFGSTNLALPVLESLLKQHDVVAVVTTPDALAGRKKEMRETPVSALAKDLKLPLFKPQNLKTDASFFLELQNLNADIFVVVAYGKILPNKVIDLPRYKTINLHPSLLPKYRGPSPIRTALLNGDGETGITFILLDDQVDQGPILHQEIFKIDPDDNDFLLSDKLAKAAAHSINKVLDDYALGKILPQPQNHAAASFTKQISKEDGKIDWHKSAVQIYNQFRAFYPWPGIWTVFGGLNLKITQCSAALHPNTSSVLVGTVLPTGMVVCGNNTLLKISRLQLAGKNEMPLTDFLNGRPDFIGSVLS